MVNAARGLRDLRIPPANHLHPLKGDQKGRHAIRVTITALRSDSRTGMP
jgi:plasmid maintenance system killer protein